MTLLKLLFVLLILLPIAFFMMYILDNLLKDAKRAKSNTIDIHDAQDAKRRARNKKKREALLRSVKESAKRREEQPEKLDREALSSLSGVSLSSIGRYLSGTTIPQPTQLERLEQALGPLGGE